MSSIERKSFHELPQEVKDHLETFDFHGLSLQLMMEQAEIHEDDLQELTSHVLMGLFFHAAVKLAIGQRLSSESIHEGLSCVEKDIEKKYPGIRDFLDEQLGREGEPLQ